MTTPMTSGVSRHSFVCILLIAPLAGVVAVPRAASAEPLFDPPAVYLTWQRDPTTTMTVHWHTIVEMPEGEVFDLGAEVDDPPPSIVQHRLRGGDGGWTSTSGTSHVLPHSNRLVHTVELTDLEPGTDYDFRPGENAAVFSFRTMPRDTTEPVRFVTGGDTLHRREYFEAVNIQAARLDPMFTLFGGDLAYADGNPERVDRWYLWFDVYKRTMVTSDGRLIPVVVAIGNHEVRGGYHGTPEQIPFFLNLFAMPGDPTYAALDFGDYMSVLLLDTDHMHPIDGPQTGWLARKLVELRRRGVPHIFPVYHVPAYPSVRNYEGSRSARIREHWVPLFEEFGVNVAFENHDHAYKRTHPLRGGEIDSRGVVYLGDGCWGVGLREADPTRWYLERAEDVRHLILVTIHGRHQHFLVVDEEGNIVDEFPATGHDAVRHAATAAGEPSADGQ